MMLTPLVLIASKGLRTNLRNTRSQVQHECDDFCSISHTMVVIVLRQ